MLKNAAKFQSKIKRKVEGVHTYDMLRNHIYSHAFQYVCVKVPDGKKREDLIVDNDDNPFNNLAQSDLVRVVLYLPFFPKKFQEEFKFDNNWYEEKFCQYIDKMNGYENLSGYFSSETAFDIPSEFQDLTHRQIQSVTLNENINHDTTNLQTSFRSED